MTMPSSGEVTQLLIAWREGDPSALEHLMPLVYRELHRLAHRGMRKEREGHTLQTSALVNEVFVKLIEHPQQNWQNRAHFMGLAAQLMRHILLDHARGRLRAKRGGGAWHIPLDEAAFVTGERSAELVALDDALKELAKHDPRKSRLVELRFFGGLTNQEVAEVTGLTLRTVEREWRKARAWLYQAVSRSEQAHEL